MRGYGESSAPEDISAYTLLYSVGDIVGLVTALGEQRAVIVGHDWGANLAWAAAQMRPDMFPAIVGMSVPFRRRGPMRPLEALRQAGKLNFYWLYFQTPGVAEAEFERDVVGTFRRLAYLHGGSFDVPAGHGFLDGFPEPAQLPDWFNKEDLAVYADSCRRTGFRGGLNWFRNIDRNWELSAPWQDVPIQMATNPVFGPLNFSSADNASVRFWICFHGGFSIAKALLSEESDRVARGPRGVRQLTQWRAFF
jgi:pimeloyl-ACP methyl ester carboxylesterase